VLDDLGLTILVVTHSAWTQLQPPFENQPHRFLRCQEQMENAIRDGTEAGSLAGWSAEEVAAALVDLADNHMLSVLTNRDLSRQLAALKPRL